MNTPDAYTNRCEILAKWLEVRNSVGNIKRVYEGMKSTHTAYKAYQEMIEEKRAELTKIQRDNPWMDTVLIELGKGI